MRSPLDVFGPWLPAVAITALLSGLLCWTLIQDLYLAPAARSTEAAHSTEESATMPLRQTPR